MISKAHAIQPKPIPTPSAVEAQLKPIAEVLQHLDIEHIPVENDPRQWSSLRKVRPFTRPVWHRLIMTLRTVHWPWLRLLPWWQVWRATSKIVGGNFEAPGSLKVTSFPMTAADEQMKEELPATDAQLSLSISLFILLQGSMPLLWSAVSEIKGRKVSHVSYFPGPLIECHNHFSRWYTWFRCSCSQQDPSLWLSAATCNCESEFVSALARINFFGYPGSLDFAAYKRSGPQPFTSER